MNELTRAAAPTEGFLSSVGATFTRTGLKFSRDLTVEETAYACTLMTEMSEGLQWALGDLMVHADCRSEEHWQAIDPIGRYEFNTVRQWRYVASRYPAGDRNPSLTFAHHVRVAKMDRDLRLRWLAMAEKEGWSVRVMMDNLAAAETAQEAEAYRILGTPSLGEFAAKRAIRRDNDHQAAIVAEERRRLGGGPDPSMIPAGDNSQAQFAVDGKVAIDPVSGLLLPLAPAVVASGRLDHFVASIVQGGSLSLMVSIRHVGDTWKATLTAGNKDPVEAFHGGGPLMAAYAALEKMGGDSGNSPP